MTLPLSLISELLDRRTDGGRRRKIVYVEDELFQAYSEALLGSAHFHAVEYPRPNLLYKSTPISPKLMDPDRNKKKKCCCCCCHKCQ